MRSFAEPTEDLGGVGVDLVRVIMPAELDSPSLITNHLILLRFTFRLHTTSILLRCTFFNTVSPLLSQPLVSPHTFINIHLFPYYTLHQQSPLSASATGPKRNSKGVHSAKRLTRRAHAPL